MKDFDDIYWVLPRERDDNNNVYSKQEPGVLCISELKENKLYEEMDEVKEGRITQFNSRWILQKFIVAPENIQR